MAVLLTCCTEQGFITFTGDLCLYSITEEPALPHYYSVAEKLAEFCLALLPCACLPFCSLCCLVNKDIFFLAIGAALSPPHVKMQMRCLLK